MSLETSESVVRSIVMATIFANALSACSGNLQQLSPTGAAQANYDKALAEYQSCYNTKRSVDACEQERQMLDANTKVLATALGH
jgi:hypothetical protein